MSRKKYSLVYWKDSKDVSVLETDKFFSKKNKVIEGKEYLISIGKNSKQLAKVLKNGDIESELYLTIVSEDGTLVENTDCQIYTSLILAKKRVVQKAITDSNKERNKTNHNRDAALLNQSSIYNVIETESIFNSAQEENQVSATIDDMELECEILPTDFNILPDLELTQNSKSSDADSVQLEIDSTEPTCNTEEKMTQTDIISEVVLNDLDRTALALGRSLLSHVSPDVVNFVRALSQGLGKVQVPKNPTVAEEMMVLPSRPPPEQDEVGQENQTQPAFMHCGGDGDTKNKVRLIQGHNIFVDFLELTLMKRKHELDKEKDLKKLFKDTLRLVLQKDAHNYTAKGKTHTQLPAEVVNAVFAYAQANCKNKNIVTKGALNQSINEVCGSKRRPQDENREVKKRKKKPQKPEAESRPASVEENQSKDVQTPTIPLPFTSTLAPSNPNQTQNIYPIPTVNQSLPSQMQFPGFPLYPFPFFSQQNQTK